VRNLSPTSLATIAQRQGIEPLVIVRVWWSDTYVDYADRSFETLKGNLISVSDIEEVINIAGTSSSTTVKVILDDSDGSLKEIFNNVDIHRKRVQLLQWFSNIPLSEAFVIFEGEIATPVEWNEGARTLGFDVLSKIEEREVGFSADEGSFDYVPPNIIGKAWPLVFGTVLGVPALQINPVPSGLSGVATGAMEILKTNEQLADMRKKMDELRTQGILAFNTASQCYAIRFDYEIRQSQADSEGTGEDFSTQIQQWQDKGDEYIDQYNQYLFEYTKIQKEVVELLNKQAQKDQLKKDTIPVLGNYTFPQGRTAKVAIGGQIYEGYFDAGNFRVTTHPEVYSDGFVPSGTLTIDQRAVITEFVTTLPPQNFIFLPGGSFVQMDAGFVVDYIVALGHVAVLAVAAQYNNLYTGVPPNYYSVIHQTYGSLQATIVRFDKPLSSINSAWNDQIYCNITSSVGPSMIDVLKYLITNYTKYTWDDTSFDAVKILTDPYPANFALTQRKNIIQVLEEIAFQSRCAIWFKGGKFYIKYLAKEEDSVETFTEDDIEVSSLEVSYTPTEDIITKYVANWQDQNYRNVPNTIIFRNNVDKYGTLTEEYNYYIYNILEEVEKSAEFWTIRKSNTWKRVSFRAFLTKLKVETWDTVTLDFGNPLVANGAVKALVESAKFDSSTWKLNITCWVPVRAGEMTTYPFAWPADAPIELIYPIINDVNAGSPNGANASGQIVDQRVQFGNVPPKATRHRMDRGRQRPIGDQHDPAFHLDTMLDSREIQVGVTPVFPEQSRKAYQIKPVSPLTFGDDLTNGRNVWFGEVVSRVEGRKYIVDVYRNGIDKPPVKLTCTQFRMRDDEEIPPTTPCVVVKQTFQRIEGTGFAQTTTLIEDYVMQVPTWVRPQPTGGSPPPSSPPVSPPPSPPGVPFP
jgi:hypothetical protein